MAVQVDRALYSSLPHKTESSYKICKSDNKMSIQYVLSNI